MPLTNLGRAIYATVLALTVVSPIAAVADGDAGFQTSYRRHWQARRRPPDVRYRARAYPLQRRHARPLGPPTDLIQAYLPRLTERPMYNEPPNRFPQR